MLFVFFFFKQKTAYEMLRSLVGSEMCIRDRNTGAGGSRTSVPLTWLLVSAAVGLAGASALELRLSLIHI